MVAFSLGTLASLPFLLTVLTFSAPSVASPSFAGSNNYFLHGLPHSDQEAYIKTLAGWGVKVLRLWATGTTAGGCTKGSTDLTGIPPLESTVGTYNTSVLDALDDTLELLRKYKVKAIISPHNANDLCFTDRSDAYCEKYKSSDTFYSSIDAKKDYDARIEKILTHKSRFSGKQWKDMSDVILAFDLQNEPMIASTGKLDANDPDDWLCGRAGQMKKILGSSNVKIATGGIGGSDYCCNHEYNLLDKALKCKAIDIMSVHGYMGKASDWAYFITGDASVLKTANAAGKHVMIEEWGVDQSATDGFDAQVKVFNDAGIPWLYWQVISGLDETQAGHLSNCGFDHFEIGISSSKGNVKAAVQKANSVTANQSWDGYVS